MKTKRIPATEIKVDDRLVGIDGQSFPVQHVKPNGSFKVGLSGFPNKYAIEVSIADDFWLVHPDDSLVIVAA